MILWIIAGVFLAVGTVWDIKKLALPRWWLLSGMVGGLFLAAYGCLVGARSIGECAMAYLPGMISLLVSRITREQMGYGDGMVMVTMGGLLRDEATWMIWMMGLGGVFVYSIFLVVTGKGTGTTKVPFVPFLLLGYLMVTGGKIL